MHASACARSTHFLICEIKKLCLMKESSAQSLRLTNWLKYYSLSNMGHGKYSVRKTGANQKFVFEL